MPETPPGPARALAAHVARHPGPVRHVGYGEAEALAEILAVRLVGALGSDGIRSSTFRAIPRGGLVALGMLAYLLDLGPRQLDGSGPSEGLLVVVDDCGLSGLRVAEALDRWPRRDVAVAHLLSPAPLRTALDRSPRVVVALAGDDLTVTASADPGKWADRLERERFWLGVVEPFRFAWSEPEHWLWDDEEGALCPGVRTGPPHRTLGNRTRLLRGPVRHRPGRCWRLPEEVVWTERDGVFWLARRPDGRVVSLAGPAADAWRLLVGWGRTDVAAQELAASWEVDAARAEHDLLDFASSLVAEGLLEGADDGPRG